MRPELPILRYFAYAHLPARLQEVSKPFCLLAADINARYQDEGGDYDEVCTGLRKLLEAKDAVVRSVI